MFYGMISVSRVLYTYSNECVKWHDGSVAPGVSGKSTRPEGLLPGKKHPLDPLSQRTQVWAGLFRRTALTFHMGGPEFDPQNHQKIKKRRLWVIGWLRGMRVYLEKLLSAYFLPRYQKVNYFLTPTFAGKSFHSKIIYIRDQKDSTGVRYLPCHPTYPCTMYGSLSTAEHGPTSNPQ